jgi:hypothetical protein
LDEVVMDDDVVVACCHRRGRRRRRGNGLATEFAQKLAGVEKATFGVGIKSAAHHRIVAFVNLGNGRARRRRSLALPSKHLVRVAARKSALSGEHLVEGRSQRVDVSACIGPGPAEELRRDVARCSHHRALGGQTRPTCDAGETEIEQLHHSGLEEEHVVRLEIAVDHASPVRDLHSGARLAGDAPSLHRAQWPSLEPVCQRFAAEQLHREEGAAQVLVQVEDTDDAGMIELASNRQLPAEAVGNPGFLREVSVQHLDRHLAPGHAIARSVDLGDSARTQPVQQFEPRSQDGAGGELGHQCFPARRSALRRRSVLPLDWKRCRAPNDHWYSVHRGIALSTALRYQAVASSSRPSVSALRPR